MKRFLVLLAPLVLCACPSGSNQMTGVLALESALTAADQVALAYFALPACSATSGNVCSNATVKAQIKTAAQTAHDTIKSAEAQASAGATVDLTASTAAMTALQSILATLPKSS